MIYLKKGEPVDYQTVIEDIVGPFLSTETGCYKSPWEMTEKEKRQVSDKERAWFFPDGDYEIVIRKKR